MTDRGLLGVEDVATLVRLQSDPIPIVGVTAESALRELPLDAPAAEVAGTGRWPRPPTPARPAVGFAVVSAEEEAWASLTASMLRGPDVARYLDNAVSDGARAALVPALSLGQPGRIGRRPDRLAGAPAPVRPSRPQVMPPDRSAVE
jgi:hypothetical protein